MKISRGGLREFRNKSRALVGTGGSRFPVFLPGISGVGNCLESGKVTVMRVMSRCRRSPARDQEGSRGIWQNLKGWQGPERPGSRSCRISQIRQDRCWSGKNRSKWGKIPHVAWPDRGRSFQGKPAGFCPWWWPVVVVSMPYPQLREESRFLGISGVLIGVLGEAWESHSLCLKNRLWD
ncbi:hypothetical protein ES703_41355 [subsurface metagenome]